MDYLGAEISKKIKSAIRAKLVELGVYVDDELPDYIMVLVANKKTKSQMERDLTLFLSDHASAFVQWLQEVLDKLQTITHAKDKEEEKSGTKSSSAKEREKKRKSSEVGSESAKKAKSDDAKEKDRKRSNGDKSKKDKEKHNIDKDAKHKEKDTKQSDVTSKKKEDRTKSRDGDDSRAKPRDSRSERRVTEEKPHDRDNPTAATKSSDPATISRRSSRSAERESGSEGRRQRRRSSPEGAGTMGEGRRHPRVSGPGEEAPAEEEDDQDVLNLSAEEDELVKEPAPTSAPRPAPTTTTSTPTTAPTPPVAAAKPRQQPARPTSPSPASVMVRASASGGGSRVVNLREEAGMFSRRLVTEEAGRRRSRSRSPLRRREVKVADGESRPSRRGPQSTVGAVVSREVEDAEYDPLNPAVGAVASTVRVTERPRRPASQQPRPTLLLKAMRDAQRSTVASVRPFLVRPQKEPPPPKPQRNKRESRELYTVGRQRRLTVPAPAEDGSARAVQARRQRGDSPGQIAITVRNTAAVAAGKSPGRRRRRRSRQAGSPPPAPLPPPPESPPESPVEEPVKESAAAEEEEAEQTPARSPEPPSSDDEDTVHVTIGKVKAHPHRAEPAPPPETPEYRPTPVLTSVDDISAIVHAVADRIKNPPKQTRSAAGARPAGPASASTPRTVAISEDHTLDLRRPPPQPRRLRSASPPPLRRRPGSASADSQSDPAVPRAAVSPRRERPSSPTFVVTMTGLGASRFARSIDSDGALGAADPPPAGEGEVVEEEEEEEEELGEEDLRAQLLEDTARKRAHPVIAPPPPDKEPAPAPAAPPKPTPTRCRFWPGCKLGAECSFYHPTVPCKTFPACKFGDSCLYVHPRCRFDGSCTRADCRFSHSSPRPPQAAAAPLGGSAVGRPAARPGSIAAECRFFPNCNNPACPFIHPKMCRYGEACSNPSCLFAHPTPALAAGRPQFKWVAPGAI